MAKKKHPKIKTITKPHNDDVTITYHLSNGNLHRMDGPAKIEKIAQYERDKTYMGKRILTGFREKHWWYRNGKLHRLDGPAVYEVGDDDKKWQKCYYKGKEIPRDEVVKYIRNGKLKELLK